MNREELDFTNKMLSGISKKNAKKRRSSRKILNFQRKDSSNMGLIGDRIQFNLLDEEEEKEQTGCKLFLLVHHPIQRLLHIFLTSRNGTRETPKLTGSPLNSLFKPREIFIKPPSLSSL